MRLITRIVLLLFSQVIWNIAKAQESLPPPPKPNFSLGVNFIGSMPQGDFSDDDPMNADAAFAKFGFGGGVFGHFSYKTGFFIQIDAAYVVRSSSVLESTVEILNAQNDEVIYSVRENPNFRHLSFSVGPGFTFGSNRIKPYVRLNFGLTRTSMSASSIDPDPGNIITFQNSGEAAATIGMAAGLEIYNRFRFELNYQNLGTPSFQLVESNDQTDFSLPIQVLDFKLGVLLFREKSN